MAIDKSNISSLQDDQGELKGALVFFDDTSGEIKAKEALTEGKRVFDILMGNLPGIAYRCFNNRQWTMEFLSSGCLELTGYSAADLIGDSRISFADLIHPEDRGRIWNEVQIALADNRQYQLEYRIRALSGEEKWVWEKGCAIKSECGEIVALEGFITDITIRKQTELALVKSESKYRRLVELSPEAVCILKEGKIDFVNSSGLMLLGASSAVQIMGKPIIEYIHPDYRGIVVERIGEIITTKRETQWLEVKCIRLDGSILEIEARASLLADNEETVQIIAHNVTHYKETERALNEALERYRSLFNSNHAVMLLINPETGAIIDANQAACAYYGYEWNQLTGLKIRDINTLNQAEVFKELQLAGKMERNYFLFPHRLASGEVRDVEVYSGPISINGKQLLYSIVHDVTERRRAEQEIVRLNRLYSVLSNVNHAIVRIRNQKDLFDKICRIIVEDGHFTLAWIGLIDREKNQFDVVSDYGKKKDFIKKLKFTWEKKNTSFWRGPSGIAIHQGKSQIINDVQSEETAELWQKLAKEYEIKSIAAFPIQTSGNIIGNLTIYATKKNYFLNAEINLLNELVSDISYAMEFMSQEESRGKMEVALRQSEERYQSFINSTSDMVFLKDEQFRIILTNRCMQDFYHKTQEELIGKTDFDLFPEEAAKVCRQTDIAALESKTVISEEVMGTQIYETVKFPVEFGLGVRGVGGYVRNITEKKLTEEKLKKSYEDLNKVMLQTIQSLAATVEMRDPYTHGHQERVTRLAVAVATEMGLSREDIKIIGLAALIHDIGKIQIPAEILNKPGKLSMVEFNLIKNHPRAGFEIISKIDFPGPVAQIVLQHHERLDGSGYPGGISGEDILPGAKVIAVADVVEAMASYRPYRPALGIPHATLEIIQNRNTLYDPLIVDTCIKIIEEQGFSFD